MLKIYTDGACSDNGKENAPGGCAFAVVNDDTVSFSWWYGTIGTTNQRMELTAAIKACQWAAENFPFERIEIYSDSAYLINCVNQNWWKSWEKNGWKNSKKQPVANPDLWKALIPFFSNENFSFWKVKGHAGVDENELVDTLAVRAKNMAKETGEDYEGYCS